MELKRLAHLELNVFESSSKTAESVEVATDGNFDCFNVLCKGQLMDRLESDSLSIVSTIDTHQVCINLLHMLFDNGKQL